MSHRVTHLGKIQRPPSDVILKNFHFDWFNRYVYTWEHFQSDIHIFRFDFIFVKPRIVPPMFCFNVKTTRDFYLKSSCLQRIGVVKSLVSGAVVIKKNLMSGTSCGFTDLKSNRNMSRSDWKCAPVHKYRLNQSKWRFIRKYQRVCVVFYRRVIQRECGILIAARTTPFLHHRTVLEGTLTLAFVLIMSVVP